MCGLLFDDVPPLHTQTCNAAIGKPKQFIYAFSVEPCDRKNRQANVS